MNTPKNFFIQVGIIVTLYVSIVSFLTFIFGVINAVFPNPNIYFDSTNSSIRYAISVLIVMFPLFIWLSRIHRKSISSSPELKDSKLRKWLLYFTLFLAGLTIAIDIIVLINTFLGGENFATSFILKVASVLVVAFGVFYFYLEDLKGKWEENQKTSKQIAIVVSVIVLVSVISGIILIGTPSKQRDLANDRQRVSDLQRIQFNITDFYQDKASLPKNLEELKDPLRSIVVPKDPETQESYKYEVIKPLTFKICAVFKTDSKDLESNGTNPMYPKFLGEEDFVHKAEETCFERTIDKDRFPLRVNTTNNPVTKPILVQ